MAEPWRNQQWQPPHPGRRRRIANWSEIERIPRRFGFETIKLSQPSFEEQVVLFGATRSVAGVHGAGLTSILSARPGISIVELLPPIVAIHAFLMFACALDYRYRTVVGRDFEYRTNAHEGIANNFRLIARDIVFDPDKPAAALAWATAAQG